MFCTSLFLDKLLLFCRIQESKRAAGKEATVYSCLNASNNRNQLVLHSYKQIKITECHCLMSVYSVMDCCAIRGIKHHIQLFMGW